MTRMTRLLPSVEQLANVPMTGQWPTVAAAIHMIMVSADLSPSRRQDLLAALKLIPRILGRPPETIELDPVVLARVFSKLCPDGLGLKAASLSTYKNSIRTVLRRLGLIDHARRSHEPLAPSWQVLRDALPDKYLSAKLQSFMAYCSELGLSPDQVNDATLAGYYTVQRDRCLKGEPLQFVQQVARAWRCAAKSIPIWPKQALSAPTSTFRYSLPITAYPATFQADVATFRQRMEPAPTAGLFTGRQNTPRHLASAPRGNQRRLASASIKTRLTAIRLAAAALVQSGLSVEEIPNLAFLVRPKNAMAILDWHYLRAGGQANDHTGTIAETLRIIGKYHVGLEGPALDELVSITNAAKPPKRQEMTAKNARRLRQFDSESATVLLIHLPETLMDVARALLDKGRHQEAAWIAQVAVAVEVELFCPLRLTDLVNLRIGTHLVKLDPTSTSFTHLMIQKTRKTGSPAEAKLKPETIDLLVEYMMKFRSKLPNANTDWLFPARNKTGQPRAATGLSTAISQAIREHTGLDMNVHLFRAFVGAITLKLNPGALEDLRLILGHATMQTTMAYYATLNRAAAVERLGARISDLRDQTRLVANAPYFKWRKRG